MICENCEGTGVKEVQTNCGQSTSLCCGGCTETIYCEDCEGTGELETIKED